MRCLGRTGVHAGRVGALVAAHRVGGHVHRARLIDLVGDELHPRDVEREEVLDPAGGDASVTAHALRQVDDHSPSHGRTPVIGDRSGPRPFCMVPPGPLPTSRMRRAGQPTGPPEYRRSPSVTSRGRRRPGSRRSRRRRRTTAA